MYLVGEPLEKYEAWGCDLGEDQESHHGKPCPFKPKTHNCTLTKVTYQDTAIEKSVQEKAISVYL